MKDMELSGQWRLANDAPESAVGGILRHSRAGTTRLELLGALVGMRNSNEQRHIWGVTTDGQAVTLADCFRVGHQIRQGSAFAESETWHVNRGLLGAHVADLGETEVALATLRIDLLASLTDHPRFEYEHQPNQTVSIEGPPEPTANWNNIAVTLSFPESFRSDHTSFEYQSGPVFECRPSAAMQLDDLQDQLLSPLKNLTSLFAGRAASTSSIELRLPNAEKRGGKFVDPPLKLFYNPIGPDEPIEHLVLPLFSLREQSLFETVVPRWLEASNEGDASSAIRQYFATQDAPAAFVELRFLSLVYVAEDYHRATSSETVQPTDVFDKRIDRIATALDAQALPAKEVKWLRGKLKRSNELSLAARIRSIVNTANPALGNFIVKPHEFAELVANTRNYLTHRTPELRERAAAGASLFWLEKATKLVVGAMIVGETGLTDEAIHDGLTEDGNLRWVRDNTRHESWGHP